MARINLLPWREWERERRKNEFLIRLGGSVLLGAVIVFAGGQYLNSSIDQQDARNQFIKDKIAVLDQQIAEIRDLRQKREQLLARMRVIQELQGNRPVIVRVFDEMVRTLAKGVFFTSVQPGRSRAFRRRHRRIEQPDLLRDAQSRTRPNGSKSPISRASKKIPMSAPRRATSN